jgi:hypothetical protein
MGKLVVSEFITMDGVVEGPGGENFERGGWAFKFNRGEEGASKVTRPRSTAPAPIASSNLNLMRRVTRSVRALPSDTRPGRR